MTNTVAVPPANQFGGPVTFTYGYDDLYRLTSATGSFEYQPGKVDQFSLTMTYDGIHNIKTKTQVHEVVQPAIAEPAIPQRKTLLCLNLRLRRRPAMAAGWQCRPHGRAVDRE